MLKIASLIVPLQYFIAAVENGSISKAAEANHVSQSAISQAISKLERALACQLTTHQPNQFCITDEGRKLYTYGKEIFHTIAKAEEALFDKKKGSIEFACTLSFSLALLPRQLKRMKLHHPNIQVNTRLAYPFEIEQLVKNCQVDFGIVLDNIDLSEYEKNLLFKGNFHLYVSSHVQNTNNLKIMLDKDDRVESRLLKQVYREHYGAELPVLMEISSWEVIANLTEEELGIGFFPDYVVERRKYLKPYLDDVIAIPYGVYAIFPKYSKRSERVNAFLDLLHQEEEATNPPSIIRSAPVM